MTEKKIYPNVEIFAAAVVSGGPFLRGRQKRLDDEGKPTEEWASEFLWWPTWSQYDQFWKEEKT